jgi:hypothetical protein
VSIRGTKASNQRLNYGYSIYLLLLLIKGTVLNPIEMSYT